MSVDKKWSLNEAIEITKEALKGGGQYNPSHYLEDAYKKLNQLQEDSEK